MLYSRLLVIYRPLKNSSYFALFTPLWKLNCNKEEFPPKNESDDAIYHDIIEKHPDLGASYAFNCIERAGLSIKPYWV